MNSMKNQRKNDGLRLREGSKWDKKDQDLAKAKDLFFSAVEVINA